MGKFSNQWTQTFPPAPLFTEKQCPNLSGKVFIVSGGISGIGYRLSQILYQRNGSVYIAGRSRSRKDALDVIEETKSKYLDSKGRMEYLSLDLDDLGTIKMSADEFLSKEERLDVLWNNAGVMVPPAGSKTKQGYELQLGVHCLGHFLFTQCLRPILLKTAEISHANSVRVVWISSLAIENYAPEGGINLDSLSRSLQCSQWECYAQSKVGCFFLASELAKKTREKGVISVCVNPGNVQTSVQRHLPRWQKFLVWDRINKPSIYGSYSELFAGISSEITIHQSGCYIVPWGRLGSIRQDIQRGVESAATGGSGLAEKFWRWCEEQTREYMV